VPSESEFFKGVYVNGTKVAIGADHAGYALKEVIKEHLEEKGIEIVDFGPSSSDPVDYPDIAGELAKSVAEDPIKRGILICGTGIGMAITANKVPGVSAAQAHDTYSAERARKSNNAQILTMGAKVVGEALATKIVDAWLESEFQEGGSRRKVDKIAAIEKEHATARS